MGRIVVAIVAICLTTFFYKMIKIRLLFYRLRKQGLVRSLHIERTMPRIDRLTMHTANASLEPNFGEPAHNGYCTKDGPK